MTPPPRWMTVLTLVVLAALLLVLTGPIAVVSTEAVSQAFVDPALRNSFARTCWTSLLSAAIATTVAIPTSWCLTNSTRWQRLGDSIVDTVLAMPPMVIGVCLLLLFRQGILRWLDDLVGVSLQTPAVVVAQTVVATALSIRLLRVAFARYPREAIEVAQVAGGSSTFVFRHAVLPAMKPDIGTAALLAWARCFGEFGPVLLFAGVTRFETEVLSTSIHLAISDGQLGVAASLAVLMMAVAAGVTLIAGSILGTNHPNSQ